MLNRILEYFVSFAKNGKQYQIDYPLGFRPALSIFGQRFFALLRGQIIVRIFVKSSTFFVFAEKGVRVKHGNCIRLKGGALLKRGAVINGLSYEGVVIGSNFSMGEYSKIDCSDVLSNIGRRLVIGDNVGLNDRVYISVRGEVHIGNNVIVGPSVSIFSENHCFDRTDMCIKDQGVNRGITIIEDDVWIGAHSVILSGVRIGTGSVIAAGSIVNKNVAPFSVVGGVPARLIRDRRNLSNSDF